MQRLSTREAAKRLGIDHATLSNYLAVGKLPAPETVIVGKKVVHMWTEEGVESVRKLLPKISNGRKTRYQKLRQKKAQAGVPVPHKKKRTKKKK